MPPPSTPATLLSPAELSYLHTSLSSTPPIRPDGRSPTQFRPLVAETDVLPGCNGSARICFADGTEAVVGVKAEVERTAGAAVGVVRSRGGDGDVQMGGAGEGVGGSQDEDMRGTKGAGGSSEWVELSIEIPGYRDDDALPVFLAGLLAEALTADGYLAGRLVISRLWHWRVFVDVSLLVFSSMRFRCLG